MTPGASLPRRQSRLCQPATDPTIRRPSRERVPAPMGIARVLPASRARVVRADPRSRAGLGRGRIRRPASFRPISSSRPVHSSEGGVRTDERRGSDDHDPARADREVRAPVDRRREHEHTLIEPMLRALGWEVEDLEVRCDYRLERADDPVEYALFVHGGLRPLVEAKTLREGVRLSLMCFANATCQMGSEAPCEVNVGGW